MAKKRIIEVQQTKSDFSLVGVVCGTEKDRFYVDAKSKKGNPYRQVNFGLEYENGKTIYVELMGNPKKDVYFYNKDGDPKTLAVEWAKRATFKKEGYGLLGVPCKLEDGQTEATILSEYDACEYIAQNLEDNMVVRVIGELSLSHYMNKNNEKVYQKKYTIKKIYLSSEETSLIDAGGREKKVITNSKPENHFFHQMTVVENVEQDKENKRFEISGKVVGYENIENIILYTSNNKLASNLKNLSKKDNVGLNLFGTIETIIEEVEVEVEDDDGWGAEDVSKIRKPVIRELWVTGADKDSLETEEFTKEKIEKAIEVINQNKEADNQFYGNNKSEEILESIDEDTADAFGEWD